MTANSTKAPSEAGYFDAPWKLARHDFIYLVLFVVVNLIAGQLGIIASLALAAQRGTAFGPVWDQAISSGALLTFSISLVVSSLAIVGSEFIDSNRRGTDQVAYGNQKILWSLIGLIVVLVAPVLVGPALAADPASPLKVVADWPHTTLWLIGMIAALQLFSLHRLPFVKDRYAATRNQTVEGLVREAEESGVTSDGERI